MSESFTNSPCKEFGQSVCQNRITGKIQNFYRNNFVISGVDHSGASTYPASAPYATTFDAVADGDTALVNPSGQYDAMIAGLFPPIPTWETMWETMIAGRDLYAINGYWQDGPALLGSPIAVQIDASFGIAKNTSGYPQTYSIIRVRQFFCNVTFGGYLTAGVLTTVAIVDTVATGTILPNQTIAMGGDIDFPFPAEKIFDLVETGNNKLAFDLYIAVIGKTPAQALSLYNFDFAQSWTMGTTTRLSPP